MFYFLLLILEISQQIMYLFLSLLICSSIECSKDVIFPQIAPYLLLKFLLNFCPSTYKIEKLRQVQDNKTHPKYTSYTLNMSHFNSDILKIQLLNFKLFHERRQDVNLFTRRV